MASIIASQLRTPLDGCGLPGDSGWLEAASVSFCADWRGRHPDPERETSVQILWSAYNLYLRFHCFYRTIFVYDGGNNRRDQLWMRDVAEVFLCPDPTTHTHYREFEVSPNGDWLDLDIFPGNKSVLFCDLKSRVIVEPDRRFWTAEIGIPMSCLTPSFKPQEVWRLNLFRIEGEEPDRFYSAWLPTHTPQPNFHIPDAFGELRFGE
jgi:alpha-galactosidase